MSCLSYLFVAFSVVWIGIFVFAGRIGREQYKLAKDIHKLSEILKN